MDVKSKSQVLDKFSRIAGTLKSTSIDDFKSKGGKVVGYFCSFIPEEIFIAAGLLPFRIRGTGSESTERADEYFTSWNCSFPRHCFNQALIGNYDFLDGFVIGASCDTIRHVYENWKHSPLKTPFVYLLNSPHVSGEIMADYFRKELVKMKEAIEKQFNAKITNNKLWDAVKLCNETRTLQQKIYDLRKSPHPPISGTDMVAVMVAGSSMLKTEYNADLKTLLGELEIIPAGENTYSARLMLVGSCGDDTIMSEIAEEQGAVIVTDHTCFGGKLKYKGVAETGGDPLAAIAQYQFLERPFCAKIGGAYELRAQVIIETAREFNVDGIIGQRLGCCDVWGGELFTLRDELKNAGIPSLMIEREYVPDSRGQLSTRVQAFIETIRR
jgi:benzoyl-CoA reductase subunit C